jgi:hypothetical protein
MSHTHINCLTTGCVHKIRENRFTPLKISAIQMPKEVSCPFQGHAILNDKNEWQLIGKWPILHDTLVCFPTKQEAETFAASYCIGMKCNARTTYDDQNEAFVWYIWSKLHDAVLTLDIIDGMWFRHITPLYRFIY